MKLSDDSLSSLVVQIDSDDYVGILLGGSYARGDATEWSDVDIACIVPDDTMLRPKWSFYRDGVLVSCGVKSFEGIRANLKRPEIAIMVARGIEDCRVLLDKDGSVAALLEEVRHFSWEPLREAADLQVSVRLMMAAEMALKVANELTKGDDRTLPFCIDKINGELTLIAAIGCGVLPKTDSTYYQQVEDAAGGEWARHHRVISGADGPMSIGARAVACLHLYRETARLLDGALLPHHRDVVGKTVRRLEESGLL